MIGPRWTAFIQSLQRAGALWVSERSREAALALEDASRLLPRRLLADAPADPTAAEVWPDAR